MLHSARTASHTTSINASRVATIGIDIGKNTFHLVGLDQRGAIVLQVSVTARSSPSVRRSESFAFNTRLKAASARRAYCPRQSLGIEVMSLAAASRDLGRRCVYRYQASRKFDASVDKPVIAPGAHASDTPLFSLRPFENHK